MERAVTIFVFWNSLFRYIRFMKTKLLFYFFFSITFFSLGQKQADNWLFGRGCGLTFTNNIPVPFTESVLNTEEGCAVISNSSGSLLFYTDGITVWNKNHKPMPNGLNLVGNPSSTQSGVAIPKPNSPGKYILFSVPATAGEPGISYSTIDMTLANGDGDIIANSKNILLEDSCTEKLTAVLHRNGKDFWVIAHKWNSDAFLAWLVTENGVVSKPIVSKIGSVHKGAALNTQGYMKVNPDGTNIALAIEDDDIIELFDFDNNSGKVTNPISVMMPADTYVYGIEFSPNGSLLYASAAGTGEIYQFNLQLKTIDEIQSSKVLVGSSPNKEWIGALQLGPDGKIYFPIYNTSYLGTIENPNTLGIGCNLKNNTVFLKGKQTALGLPTFNQSFFEHTVAQEYHFFDASKVKKGEKMVLKNIQFDFAKSTLKTVSNAELIKVVSYLKSHPDQRILLSGHTDNIGNKSSNLTLSDNRALAVKNFLVANGIRADRIETKGKGSSEPLVSNGTDAGRAINRRVEILFL